MRLRKMRTSWGKYLSGLFVGIFCANADRYLRGAEAVEKDITTAIIIYSAGIILLIVLNIFTRTNVTKINDKEIDLCDVKINTTNLPDNRIRITVAGLEKRSKKETLEVMNAIRDLCISGKGTVDEI